MGVLSLPLRFLFHSPRVGTKEFRDGSVQRPVLCMAFCLQDIHLDPCIPVVDAWTKSNQVPLRYAK